MEIEHELLHIPHCILEYAHWNKQCHSKAFRAWFLTFESKCIEAGLWEWNRRVNAQRDYEFQKT